MHRYFVWVILPRFPLLKPKIKKFKLFLPEEGGAIITVVGGPNPKSVYWFIEPPANTLIRLGLKFFDINSRSRAVPKPNSHFVANGLIRF